jgi:hypothetical protein
VDEITSYASKHPLVRKSSTITGGTMYHPEGFASLVAAILVTGDVSVLPEEKQAEAEPKVIDFRRTQVLELAREYYKVHPCDFENGDDQITPGVRNGKNNRAKLSRANLKGSLVR